MKYDIAALKRKMLVKYPFFGSVVADVKYKENDEIPTAGTDGKTIYYNPNYLNKLSVDEQTFVFAHEVCHIAFNHILRSEGKNPELWNIATDAVINQFLIKDGLKMVEGGVNMAEAINYDAEKLYEKLLKEKNQNEQNGQQQQKNQQNGQQNDKQQNGQQSSSGSDSSQDQSQEQSGSESGENEEDQNQKDVGHDTHNMWEKAVKEHKEEQKNSEKNEVEKKQEELEKMGEKDSFQKNHEVKKKQLKELKESLYKQASKAGISTNRDIRTVNNIGKAKPIVDWRFILREAMAYTVDWSYDNATIEDGVLVPHLEKIPVPETEILLDTSGSIDEALLRNFLRECKNILKHTELKVGCFDTEFYGFHEIRTEKDIENMRFEGGGGTNFNVAVNAFSGRVENKIIFTDGEASMPNKAINAIWIVFGGEKINPKGGRVIQITSEQLDRLYSYKTDDIPKGRLR